MIALMGTSGENEEGDKHDLELVLSFTKAHTSYKTVKSFFYAYSTASMDEQNISAEM